MSSERHHHSAAAVRLLDPVVRRLLTEATINTQSS
jgi:hypothetical protein